MITCRHEECEYYGQHEFRDSVAICEISAIRCAFNKGDNIPCQLEERISATKEFLRELEYEYMKHQLAHIEDIVFDDLKDADQICKEIEEVVS